MIRLADFVVKFLASKGIKTVFTVSGGGSIFLCDALYKSKKLIMFHIITSKQHLSQLKVTLELIKKSDVAL